MSFESLILHSVVSVAVTDGSLFIFLFFYFVVYDFQLWVLLHDFPFPRLHAARPHSGQPAFLQTWEWTQWSCSYPLWVKPFSSCFVLGRILFLRFPNLYSKDVSWGGLCLCHWDICRLTWDLSVEFYSTCSTSSSR